MADGEIVRKDNNAKKRIPFPKTLIFIITATIFAFSCAWAEPAGDTALNETQIPTRITMEKSAGDTTAYLDVQMNPDEGRYVLLVNGNPMEWEQDIDSAVSFCRQNGIAMDTFTDGNGVSGEQKIIFGQDILLYKSSALWLDQGANQTRRLNGIRMYTDIDLESGDEAGKKAQEIFENLQTYLGHQPERIVAFTGSDTIEILDNDMIKAVEQMMQNREGGYAFAAALFNNLNLNVLYWEGELSIKIDLTIF